MKNNSCIRIGNYCSICLNSRINCTCAKDSITPAIKNIKKIKSKSTKKDQTKTPKYWIGYDPTIEDVYIDTAAKDYKTCENKFFNEVWAGDEDSFYLALSEGQIGIKLFSIDFVNDGIGDEGDMLVKPLYKSWVKLCCIKDYKMDDGEVAFTKGKYYMFAHYEGNSYVTVSNDRAGDHIMSSGELRRYFKEC